MKAKIEALEARLLAEEQRRRTAETENEQHRYTHAKRNSLRRSIDIKTNLNVPPTSDAALLERIRLLEEERLESAVRFDRELTVRDTRLDQIMAEWRTMSVKLATTEAQNDSLRQEIVTQADIEDRLRLDIARSDKLIGSLELLLETSRVKDPADP
ncbi:hypothetical protein MRB53_040524 [Persea americana]|nr:hypothetical protein MRB53_040524 [Persea americana]